MEYPKDIILVISEGRMESLAVATYPMSRGVSRNNSILTVMREVH